MSLSEEPKRQQSIRVSAFDDEILVGEHRALRAAGGARGIEDRGQIAAGARRRLELRRRGGDRIGECSIAIDAEALDRTQAELPRKRSNRLDLAGPAEGQRRLGVAKEIFELGERIGGVQRQQNRAGAKASQREHDCVG